MKIILILFCLFTIPNLFAKIDDSRIISKEESKALNYIHKDRIKILIWNVHKGDDSMWRADFHAFSQKVDFALIQEAFLDANMSSEFSQWENFEWDMVASWYKNDIPTGVATLSRYKAINKFAFLSNYSEPIIKTPKTALATHYKIKNTTQNLLVVNIHSLLLPRNSRYIDQLNEIQDLISSHSGPVIFAGDFNTWRKGRREALARLVSKLGLTPVEWTNDHRKLILDHAFVRDLEITNAKVLGSIDSSDHSPLLLKLKLN